MKVNIENVNIYQGYADGRDEDMLGMVIRVGGEEEERETLVDRLMKHGLGREQAGEIAASIAEWQEEME